MLRPFILAAMMSVFGLFMPAKAVLDSDTAYEDYGSYVGRSQHQIAGLNAATAEHPPGELFWQAIKDSKVPALFEAYLKRSRRGQFDGRHTDAAAARLSTLRGEKDPAGGDGTYADTSANAGFAPMTVDRTVTVRARPAFDAESVGKLAAGDTVTARIANVEGPWHKIVLDSGRTGYVLENPFGGDRRFE